jgi:hypothetical protein
MSYLTEIEMAQQLRRNPRTLKRWRDTRGLPFISIGGRVLYDPRSVERWMHEHERQELAVA